MSRIVNSLFLWLLAGASAVADLSFTFNHPADVAVTATGYSASGSLDLTLGFQPSPGQNLAVVNNTGTAFISGTFDGIPQGAAVPLTYNGVTYHYVANYFGGSNGRSLVLQWPDLQMVGWGYDNALQGNATTGYGAAPSLLANEGGLSGKTVIATSPGGDHALALTADGKIYAWGNNSYGQLGNGTQVSSSVPVQVDANGALAGKTVVAIAASSSHNLALTADGRVFGWGDNGSGRLGDGTTQMRLTPVAVDTSGALTGKTVVAIAAGQYHSLALSSDGLVFAWGYGFQGQLGNGSIDNQFSPVPVDATGVLAGKTVTGISAGFYHSVAVAADGTVATWGFNTTGQLGNNSTSPSPLPVQVVSTGSLSGKTVTDVRAGSGFNLALTSDGQVHAWGGNGGGQLGIGSTSNSLVPALAGGSLSGKTVISIGAGNAHATALTADGQPHVWGSDGYGELGNGVGPEVSALVPTLVPGLGPAAGRRVAAVFSGANRIHVLTDPGPPRIRVNPIDLTANAGASAGFTAAVNHPFPTSVRWQMSPSGAGGAFQDITDEPSATTGTLMLADLSGIADGTAFRAVFSSVSGSATSNPATLHKTVWPATFSSSAGPLATVTAASVAGNLDPVLGFEPTPGTDLTLIRTTGPAPISGRFANLAQGSVVPLTHNGVTYHYIANYFGGNGRSLVLQWPAMGLAGWGSNYSGVLGDIGDASQNPPVGIPLAGPLAGKTILDVSMSGGHVLALTSEGKVYAWGDNSSGQLGNNSTTKSKIPVAVDTGGALAGKIVVAIAAGENHSFAITSDGRLHTWGKRRAGNGVTLNSLTPVEFGTGGLLDGKTVVAVSPGGSFDLALTSEGEIYGWGENNFGQLSGYNNAYRVDPVRIEPGAIGTTPVIAIAAGDDHCLAIDLDGQVFAWGGAQDGALGINSGPTDFSVVYPVAVHTNGVLAGKTIAAIAARDRVSMAVATDGTVYSWGKNWSGELGDGTTTNRSVPVAVDTSGVLAGKFIAAAGFGLYHCMVMSDQGELFAWGDNGNSQLGDGGWTDSLFPLAVTSNGVMQNRKANRFATGFQSSIALIGLGAPTVTRHPLDLMTAEGQTATFTAAAEDPFSFSVKWQVSPTGIAGPFSDIAGDTNTLTLPPITAAQNGWAYRAVFTSDAGQTDSEPAVLRVVEWSATLSPVSYTPFQSERVLASGSFDLQLDSAPATGMNLTLVENTGPAFISGAFDNVPQGGLVTLTHGGVDYPFIANYHGGNGRSLVLQWPWTSVAGWGLTYGTSPVSVTTRPALAAKTITSMRAGSGYQLVLTMDGKAFGWGSNNYGQLGNTLTASSSAPVAAKDDGALAGKTLVAIASGTSHNLALSSDGKVFSWGYNFDGQLGDGSKTNRTQPVAVVVQGALDGKTVTAIAAGESHSLALSADGEVFAWGSNSYDQLGTEAWQDSTVPVAVDKRGVLRTKTVVAIAVGTRHSLALTRDGEVIAWGANANGQLGNGDTTDSRIPVKVDTSGAIAGKRVVAIAAGEDHSAALTSDGLIFTWGGNGYGQLGNNATPTGSTVPVAVATDGVLSGKTAVAVSAGLYQCVALTAEGAIVSWGLNTGGQLGNGGNVNSPVPVSVVASGVLAGTTVNASLATSNRSFALLGVPGTPFITAVPRNRSHIIGTGAGSVSASFSAAALDPLPISIQWQEAGATGGFFDIPSANTSALQINGLTSAMDGRRYRASFSNAGGSATTTHATLDVGSAESPVVFPNADHIPFTEDSPTLHGSLNVQLGFAPTPGVELTLVRNSGAGYLTEGFANLIHGTEIQLAYEGINHSFVVDYFGDNGRSLVLHWAKTLAAGWGSSSSGQLGSGNNLSINRAPVAVTDTGVMAGQTLVRLAAGTSHSLALAASGKIFAWGANGSGRLGNSSTTSSNVPVEVYANGILAGKQVTSIAAGGTHSLALTSDGQVAAWGSNSSGQLGTGGSTSGSAVPAAVSISGILAGKTVIAIAAGGTHSVALLSDGTMAAWGLNSTGQLGTGNTTTATLPASVLASGALTGKTVVAIAAGAIHTLALTADGRVYSWGSNQSGQLGIGTSFPSSISSPTAVSGSGLIEGKTVIAIAAGTSHSLAVTADGKVYAWGLGSSGQLGSGSFSGSYSPLAVSISGVLAGKSIVSIAAGGSHSLAIDSNGQGYAWGSNSSGQLGNNSTSSTATSPVALSTQGAVGSRPLTAIAAGGTHSLAIAGRGTAPIVTQPPDSQTVTAGSTVILTAAADGYPAPTVRWQRSTMGPGGTFTDIAGQTTTTLQLTNVTASQTGYAYRAVFTNLEAVSNSQAAVLTVRPTLATFLASRSLPANSPPLDDPFHTGISNLLAYAFDLDPAAPDRTKLPAATKVDGRLRISYVRWKNATDLSYTVQAGDSLDGWQSGPGITETVSVTSLDNARETVVEQEILPNPLTSRFLRVRVVLVPP